MDNFESEHGFDGDWDERGHLVWNEFDWRRYLSGANKEIERFLSIYSNLRDQPDRLDETARLMGWETEDWSSLEDFEDEAEERAQPDFEEDLAALREDDGDLEPYTLHKHPVYIASRAIYAWLHHACRHFFVHGGDRNTAQLGWHCASLMHRGEMQAILAVQALDLGDFALAVCHLKTGLGLINDSLGLLEEFRHPNPRLLRSFKQEAGIRLFDLREIWLRVMQDCREENRRRYKDRD
jgi:hypothetical protein